MKKYRFFFPPSFPLHRDACVGCRGRVIGKCVCMGCACVCLVYLQNGGGWRNIWGCVLSPSDLAAIEEISCSLRRLRSKPLHLSLRSFTFALDPSPIQIFTTFFPHRLQFFFFFFAPPSHTTAVSSIRCPPPSSSVRLHPRLQEMSRWFFHPLFS